MQNLPRHFKKQSHKSLFNQALYDITIVAGVISPLMTLPQIYKIFSTHNAAGVSVLSWLAFAVLDFPFIIYGFVQKEKPIIITYSLFFIGNLAVVAGALKYG